MHNYATQSQGASEFSQIMPVLNALNQAKLEKNAGRDGRASETVNTMLRGSYESIKNSASFQFGTFEDFVVRFQELMNPGSNYDSLYDYYRAKNGGGTSIAINDLAVITKSRNQWGNPSYGMKSVDDNTNQRVIHEFGSAIPFTSKTFEQPWRQSITGGVQSDIDEARRTVKLGEDNKMINGAFQSGNLLGWGGYQAHGFLTTPHAEQVVLSDWYANPENISLELKNLILQVEDYYDTRIMTSTRGAGADICVLLPVELKSAFLNEEFSCGDKCRNILEEIKQAYPDVDIQFSHLVPSGKVIVWNNNRQYVIYPEALAANPIAWSLCNPYAGDKWTMLSVNGIHFIPDCEGGLPLVIGTITTTP